MIFSGLIPLLLNTRFVVCCCGSHQGCLWTWERGGPGRMWPWWAPPMLSSSEHWPLPEISHQNQAKQKRDGGDCFEELG